MTEIELIIDSIIDMVSNGATKEELYRTLDNSKYVKDKYSKGYEDGFTKGSILALNYAKEKGFRIK